MIQLRIITNVADSDSDVVITSEKTITEILTDYYGDSFPKHAKLYYKHVSEDCEVTPNKHTTLEEFARLEELQGEFFVVVPTGFSGIVAAIISIVVGVAMAFLFTPKIPNGLQRNIRQSSPNNELSERVNNARLEARVPDIFGTVRSTPDLIAVPYVVYENNIEYEVCAMCIGRGEFEIYDVKDDTTHFEQIEGSSIQVYAPNTNLTEDEPFFEIGRRIPDYWPFMYPKKSNSVNGQILKAPNQTAYRSDFDIVPNPNTGAFEMLLHINRNFTEFFAAGDTVRITRCAIADGWNKATVTAAIYSSNSIYFLGSPPTEILESLVAGSVLRIDNTSFDLVNRSYIGQILDPFDYDDKVIKTLSINGEYVIQSLTTTMIQDPTGSIYAPNNITVTIVTLQNPASINTSWNDVTGLAPGNVFFTRKSTAIETSKGGIKFNLNGIYTVLSVTEKILTFENPAAVNPDWNKIPLDDARINPIIENLAGGAVGPFIIEDVETIEYVLLNFVAPNGLWKDDGKSQSPANITGTITYWAVDENGDIVGDEHVLNWAMQGSSTDTNTKALSSSFVPEVTTRRLAVQVERTSDTDNEYDGQVVDEVRWRHLYGAKGAKTTDEGKHFPHVTTLRSITKATTGALEIKSRKLNLKVGRKINIFDPNQGRFSDQTQYTDKIEHIIPFIITDPYIGNLSVENIDGFNIFETMSMVREYFGGAVPLNEAAQFCYTFDKDNISTEETIQSVANAGFCTAHRDGAKIKLSFTRKEQDATVLFNHRNKIPASEKRTVSFGNENNYEGIEYKWVDPEDDSVATLKVPEINNGVGLKKVESVGIRNLKQATLHANRQYALLKYQYSRVEFQSLSHGELLSVNDVILNADNTKASTQDGEVMAANGLVITTSQPVQLQGSSTIFLQLPDKTIQSMQCYPIAGDEFALQLSEAPRLQLVTDNDVYSRTGYTITSNTSSDAMMYIVTEATPSDNGTVQVSAVNYDDRLYENDGIYRQ